MFFHYRQNNSGGDFDFIKGDGLTRHVVVEAADAPTANDLAERIGLYFDAGRDCPCCGPRWSPQWYLDSGSESPTVYGEAPAEFVKNSRSNWMEPGFEIAIHFADGRIEWH